MDGLGAHAGDADDPGQGAQFLDHAGQVHAVVHADHQLDHADAAIAFVHADFLDIAVGRVHAAGQQGVDYGDLMSVMDALRAAGYLKVGLVGLETAAKK